MIIRVLGEGQWRVDKAAFKSLSELDDRVSQAVADHDQDALTSALTDLVERVTCHGDPLDDDEIVESDLILPDPAATIDDVEALLVEGDFDGLIPDQPTGGTDD